MRTIMTIVSVWLMAGMSLAEGVRLGMTRAQVEAELGAPASTMERGDRTILMYAEQGRVELIGGRVVEAAFVPIDDSTEPPVPPLPLPVPTPTSSAIHADPAAPTGGEVMAEPATSVPKDQDEPKESPLRRESATQKRLDDEDALLPETAASLSPTAFWSEFALGALVRLLITVMVLKAAFRWVDVHADWGQMFVPSLADTLTRGLIGVIAYALWHADQLFYLDEGVAYFVLLFALVRTTHASTLQRAVAVSAAAKVASIVVWSFVSVFVTRWVL